MDMLRRALGMVFSRENVFAFCLCMIAILLIIVTADSAPQWIYQGF
jgi:hypothetical protein